MNKEMKYFLFFILLITLIVVFHRYQQYVVNNDFMLKVNAVCDPSTEKCFTADCSPSEDSECDDSPYKKVNILDAHAPKCLEEHSCSDFSCEGINNCSITYCSEDNLEDGEKCLESVSN